MNWKLLISLSLAVAGVSCKSEKSTETSGGEITEELSSAGEESYILFSAEVGRTAGMVVLMSEEMTMEGGTFRMETPQGVFEGTVGIHSLRELKLENETKEKVMATLEKHEVSQKMIMDGKELPQPPQVKPLVGVPLVVTYADGGWSAEREDGEETAEAVRGEIEKIVKKVAGAEAKSTFGSEARKPGDTWEVEATEMLMMEDSEDVNGEIKLSFDRVGDHEGMNCAFLSGTMKVNGGPPASAGVEGGSMQVEGSFTIIRSIEHQVDLRRDLDATMMVKMDTPAGVLAMSGPTKVTEKAVIEK